MTILVAAMLLDLGTWLLVPESIRASAESNPLATSPVFALLLKVAAIGLMVGLIARIHTRSRRLAFIIGGGVTLVGAASNLSVFLI